MERIATKLEYNDTFVNIISVIGKYVDDPLTIKNNVINIKTDKVSLYSEISDEDFSIENDNSVPEDDEDYDEDELEENELTLYSCKSLYDTVGSFPTLPNLEFDEEWMYVKSGKIELKLMMGEPFLVNEGDKINMDKHDDKKIYFNSYLQDIINGSKKVKSKTFEIGITLSEEKERIVSYARSVDDEFGQSITIGDIVEGAKEFRFDIDAAKIINGLDDGLDEHDEDRCVQTYILVKNKTAFLLIQYKFPDSDSYIVFKYDSIEMY